ncbi:MAG: ribosome silencing factor [Pseudomonadales bacterium]|nr:ribosome silencing factor [Pseudomonadales bacterium]
MKKKSASTPALLNIIINALDELKAQDVTIIDVSRLSDVTDTLVIASGSSNRQVRALAENAATEAKKQGMPTMGIEGMDVGEWVLADFGDVVLHVMQPEVRSFYELEKLWLVPGSSEIIPLPSKTASVKKSAAAKSTAKQSSAKKPATTKPAAKKPSIKAAATKKAGSKKTQSDDNLFINQSDAAKARRKPAKPKAPARTAASSNKKAAPAKAGVLAKTGTRKTASAKPAANKSVAKKPAATKSASKKTAAKKTAASKPRAR